MNAIGNRANHFRQSDFVRVRLCARNPVRRPILRILKTELNVIEPRIHQRLQSCFGQADSRSDQIGIKSGSVRGLNEIFQVRSRHWLTASQMKMQNSQLLRFPKHADPILGRKFRLSSNHLQRIRAIDAMQGTAMRDLGNQRQWVRSH